MATLVPVVCENPKCASVWWTESFISIENSTVEMTGNRIRPCPICGDWGVIPDGTYTDASIDFFRKDQFESVLNALVGLSTTIQNGGRGAEIRKEIEENPSLEFLKGFMPKDWKGVNEFLKTILMFIAIIGLAQSSCSPTSIQMRTDLLEILKKGLDNPP